MKHSFASLRWLLSILRENKIKTVLGLSWVSVVAIAVTFVAILLQSNPGDADLIRVLQMLLDIQQPIPDSRVMYA